MKLLLSFSLREYVYFLSLHEGVGSFHHSSWTISSPYLLYPGLPVSYASTPSGFAYPTTPTHSSALVVCWPPTTQPTVSPPPSDDLILICSHTLVFTWLP